MRHAFIAIAALIASPLVVSVAAPQAVAAEIAAMSKVEGVTIFLSGAEVTRAARVTIDRGEHVVVFSDIPAAAVAGSIRVEGKATGKLEIGSVDTRRTLLSSADTAAADIERERIQKDIEALGDQRILVEGEVQAAETQKTLIANLAQLPSRPVPSGTQSPAGEDWVRTLSLITSATAEAQKGLVAAQVRLRETDRSIEDLQRKLSALAPSLTSQTEVKVYVAAATPLEADLTIRYQVPGASWTPLYDARLETGSKTAPPRLDLKRRAEIKQTSGETWTDVAIQLSTTRPSSGAAAPILDTETVDFEQDQRPVPVASAAPPSPRRLMMKRQGDADREAAEATPDSDALTAGIAAPVAVEEKQAAIMTAPFQAVFVVPGKLTVPGTGEAKRVSLEDTAMDPALAIRTVAKLDAKAYLYAKFTLPKGTPTLPGPVFLFRDGTFVGTGQLPLLMPGEEPELGFGVDDQVRVRHTVVDEKRGETGLISSSRTDSRNYRVTVKNMHERAVQLAIVDQVPVSLNQEIKVEYTGKAEPTKKDVEGKRGIMTFESKLEPDEEKVFDFGYRITWPAAKSISFGR